MPRKKKVEKAPPPVAPKGSPEDLYQQEKARRGARRPTFEGRDLLAEAEAEFKALLEAEAAAGRGGRPRKMVEDKASAPGAGRKAGVKPAAKSAKRPGRPRKVPQGDAD